MENGDTTLDGNAAAGLLQEVFPFEMTQVQSTCAGCGAVEELGASHAYANAPGLVIRCRHCQTALVRIAHAGERYWLDLRGATCLELRS
jgi:Family of unknown function (DUF6510)